MKKNIRPFSLENSGDDRPKMFLPTGKIRHVCLCTTLVTSNSSEHYFRNSEQFKTAVKLGREMLLEVEGRPQRIVLDLPVNEGKEGEDDPGEEDEDKEEDPIQEQDQGVPDKLDVARKGHFNLKVTPKEYFLFAVYGEEKMTQLCIHECHICRSFMRAWLRSKIWSQSG